MKMNYLLYNILFKIPRHIIVITLLFSVISCSIRKDLDYWNEILENITTDDIQAYTSVIIIPEAGCTGCISQAERYYMDNKDSNEILFVFTNITSKKTLRLRMGTEIFTSSNVLFDFSDSIFPNEYADRIYPHKISIDNGHVTNVEIF